MNPLTKKFTLADLRGARSARRKVAMLTCYDFTTARIMQSAGVPMLLVGDSAANVILGHETTLPVPLSFMIELTAAVRRGAPLSLVIGDMPFGSYQGSVGRAIENVCDMVKLSGCDCVKLEVGATHARLIRRLADAGIAVMAHLGLRPQSVGLLGGYRFQGRTAAEATAIVDGAATLIDAGAAAILLEAVPPELSAALVAKIDAPVIGCGAGPACDGAVVVIHDLMGLSPKPPRFVPVLGGPGKSLAECCSTFVDRVADGTYPATEHDYVMPVDEKSRFLSEK